MTPPIRVLQIDHVELFVPDRYEAAAWYARVLGLEIVREYEDWATGGGPLMISSDGGSTKLALFTGQQTASTSTTGFHRVAFRVAADGFAAFLGRLGEMSVQNSRNEPLTLDAVVDHGKAYSIYFSDPYGHLLEITTYDYSETRAQLDDLRSRTT